MDWVQFLILFLTIMGFFISSRQDRAKTDSVLEAIKEENKDFHGRLCTLEERYFQLMQKYFQDKS